MDVFEETRKVWGFFWMLVGIFSFVLCFVELFYLVGWWLVGFGLVLGRLVGFGMVGWFWGVFFVFLFVLGGFICGPGEKLSGYYMMSSFRTVTSQP